MTDNNQTLYLVDGTAFVYRAFHAFTLTTAAGEPTGVIYGVGSMLNKLVRDHSPEHLVVVFDAKGKNFRHALYPQYKENRPPMPDDMRKQYEVVKDLVDAMGIHSISIPEVEADDVIGTLAITAAESGITTVIASNDKDLAQLVNDKILMLDEAKGELIHSEQVQQKYGVQPQQIIDFLSLVGDSSDNIPGIPLVGKKTASKWLNEYGSIKNIMEVADKLPGKAGENFRSLTDQLTLSRELIQLKLDVDVELDMEQFKISNLDKPRLREIYQKLEFHSWLKELDANDQSSPPKPLRYTTIDNETTLKDLVARIEASGIFAFDTETTGLDTRRDSLVGISISVIEREAFYIPINHSYIGVPQQLSQAFVIEQLKPLFESPNVATIAHNLKFDACVLANVGIEIKGAIFDTMLESYVVNSSAAPHKLDRLALKFLNTDTTKYEDVVGKGKGQLTFDQVEVADATNYAAEDADIALRLHNVFWPQIQDSVKLQHVFKVIDMPLVPVLMRMENHGVRLDTASLARQSADLLERMNAIEAEIYQIAGTEFNLSSPKQIGEVLFERLGLPGSKKTSKGEFSTAESVLAELAINYDVPRLILDYRSLFKLKSTYTDKLPKLINPSTQRVHTSYQQAVAVTGRLSSVDPNLQNIPIRTSDGKHIRESFIAEPGGVLVSVDYSQIELRLMAHLSSDAGLLEAFAKGHDIHSYTAAEVFGAPLDAVSFDQRRQAKAINFGLIYGMSAFGLSQNLQLEVALAQAYIDQYFARYPKVREFMDRVREQAKEHKFVDTLYGRRIHLPDISSRHYGQRQHAERAAINAPLQGSAADIMKLAMIEVDRWLVESGCQCKMIMQVHDELVLECAESEQDEVISNVKRIMENTTKLQVPLIADAGVGLNWALAHE